MNFRERIDMELKEIHMSHTLKQKIKTRAFCGPRRFLGGVAVVLAVLIFGGSIVFAGVYSGVQVNGDRLPALDEMYCVQTEAVDFAKDEYGMSNEKISDYRAMQNKLGIYLLDSEFSNPGAVGSLRTDRRDFAILTMENYIFGTAGENSAVSLTVEIMLSEEQMQNGWETDYLGLYRFAENYVSEQGYRVNLIEDTTGTEDAVLSQKCAVFVADGIRYTLKGRISTETMKTIVDSMHY